MMATDTKTAETTNGGIKEMVRIIIHALILVFVFKTFLYQPFIIPSSSMAPTLLVGDYLLTSKFSYGYSKYSFPFWKQNLFEGRIWTGQPKRGDVVVFRLPNNPSKDYIKRVIGLPGDNVQVVQGVLHINGEPVQLKKLEDFVGSGKTCYSESSKSRISVPRYIETLSNGVKHEILRCPIKMRVEDTPVFIVPPGNYFMMGDNRNNSLDSRVSRIGGGVGFVPEENLIGRAEMLVFSVSEDIKLSAPWQWPAKIRWSRAFNLIQ
jgi:signal peptidase I